MLITSSSSTPPPPPSLTQHGPLSLLQMLSSFRTVRGCVLGQRSAGWPPGWGGVPAPPLALPYDLTGALLSSSLD